MKKQGFTLIELLIVLFLIAVLFTLFISIYGWHKRSMSPDGRLYYIHPNWTYGIARIDLPVGAKLIISTRSHLLRGTSNFQKSDFQELQGRQGLTLFFSEHVLANDDSKLDRTYVVIPPRDSGRLPETLGVPAND